MLKVSTLDSQLMFHFKSNVPTCSHRKRKCVTECTFLYCVFFPVWLQITGAESRIQEKLTVPGGIVKHQGKHIRILENKLNQVLLLRKLSNPDPDPDNVSHLQIPSQLISNLKKIIYHFGKPSYLLLRCRQIDFSLYAKLAIRLLAVPPYI